MTALLDIRGLVVEFDTPEGVVKAVNGLDVRIGEGETLVGVVHRAPGRRGETAMRFDLFPPPWRFGAAGCRETPYGRGRKIFRSTSFYG